jgi:hypothetical protein
MSLIKKCDVKVYFSTSARRRVLPVRSAAQPNVIGYSEPAPELSESPLTEKAADVAQPKPAK